MLSGKGRLCATIGAMAFLTAAGELRAQSGADFFRGKSVSYIVPTAAGGGYDLYGRLVSEFMQKHLPGSTFVVKNMPGAAHVLGTNTLYASRADGLTIGTFNMGLLHAQIVGSAALKFDLRRMSWIGKAAEDFARALEGKVAYSICGNLATALTRAAALAREEKISGAAVLLSPACASFDQFANFEARGDAFRSLVHGMTRRDSQAKAPEPQGARP